MDNAGNSLISNYEQGTHKRRFFSIIYNLCLIILLIALFLPEINTWPAFFRSPNYEIIFFWNQNLTRSEFIIGFILFETILAFMYIINRFSDRIRSAILFFFFSFTLSSIFLFLIIRVIIYSNQYTNRDIFIFSLLFLAITFYSFTVLLKSFNIKYKDGK